MRGMVFPDSKLFKEKKIEQFSQKTIKLDWLHCRTPIYRAIWLQFVCKNGVGSTETWLTHSIFPAEKNRQN